MSNEDWKEKFVEWLPCGLPQSNSQSSLPKESLSGRLDDCTKMLISCFGDQHIEESFDSFTPMKVVPENVLLQIFWMLNHGDLLRCRLVQKEWNFLISASDTFLDSTVYTLTTDLEVGLQVFGTFTPYRNTKFLNIDYEVYLKKADFDPLYSENYFFHPSQRFLGNVKRLECRFCYITWETLKRILTSTLNLQDLIISQCILSDEVSMITSSENAGQNNTCFKDVLSKLKRVTIFETLDLDTINKILGKLLSFSSRYLEDIEIGYKPHNSAAAEDGDVMTFCHSLLHIIQVNSPSLKNVTLDLEDEIIINRIPPMIEKLESFWKILKLKTFCLNPSSSATITQDSLDAARILIKFFLSQKDLTRVAIPFIERSTSNCEETYTKLISSIVPSLPLNLKSLHVPSANYLGGIAQFTSISSISVGSHGKERFSIDNLHDLLCSDSGDSSFNVFTNIKSFAIALTKYSGGSIKKSLESFSQLTSLKIESTRALIRDEDLQTFIDILPALQSLSITKLDQITDFGITGVPLEACTRMSNLESHLSFPNVVFTSAVLGNGKPLSHLKGLRYLSLEGKTEFSDFGINFGLRFLELKYVRLPWSEKITDWGIRRLAKMNPSLEVVDLCGVNKRSLEGFLNLTSFNPRIKQNLCSHGAIHEDCPILPNFITQLPEPWARLC